MHEPRVEYDVPMVISKERLFEFMWLYQDEFEEAIGEDEAREIASQLVELYQLLAEPLPSEIKQHEEADPAPPQALPPPG